MKNYRYRKCGLAVLVMAVLSSCLSFEAFAALPELKSAGKYIVSKGTKAAGDYQGRAGGPSYEYGKGLRLGALTVKPFVQYVAEWTDNVFFDEEDEKDDLIHNLGLGAGAEMPLDGGRHLLYGSYAANFQWFDQFSSQDHTDQAYKAGFDLNFVPFSLSAEDTFRITTDRSDTEFTTRVPRNENYFDSLLEIPFARFFLETEGTDLDINYRSPENSVFDHNIFTIYQRVGVDVGTHTQFLAEYAYIGISYDNADGRDGDGHQAMLGLRGQATARISYQVWGGAQWRTYDDDSRPDFNDFVFRGSVQYDISESSYLILKGVRTPQESTFDDQSFYVKNKGELTWRQRITERLYVNSHGSLSYNDYSRKTVRVGVDTTREDYVWDAGVGLEYFMPNDLISFFGDYKVQSRDSNIPGFDYDSQVVSVGVKSLF